MSIVSNRIRSRFATKASMRTCLILITLACATGLRAAPPVTNVTIQFADGTTQSLSTPAPSTQPSSAAPTLPIIIGKGDAPLVVHARLPEDVPLDAVTLFDFGDTARFSRLPGFNAAHIYDTPGTYRITAYVNGNPVGVANITVHPDARRRIYVAPNGDPTSPGLTSDTPTALARAQLMLNDDTELLFKRGSTFTIASPLQLKSNNVIIGAYGAGDRPVFNLTSNFLETDAAANHTIVQDLVFDTPSRANDTQEDGMPVVFTPRGTNFAVRNCEFRNIDTAVNSYAGPTGLLVQGNSCPLTTGLRGYFVWLQAKDSVIIGNAAANSTRQHIVRGGGWQRTLIAYNDFANPRSETDASDINKSCVNLQPGDSAVVYANLLHSGNISVGPLINQEGQTFRVLIDSNVTDSASIIFNNGSHDVLVRNNLLHQDMNPAIAMGSTDTTYNRPIANVTITHNTAINNAQRSNFLLLGTKVDNLILDHNLYVAPNLLSNTWGVAPIDTQPQFLSSFKVLSGNVWPTNVTTPWPFNTPAEFSTLAQSERFEAVTLDAAGNPPVSFDAGAHRTGPPTTSP